MKEITWRVEIGKYDLQVISEIIVYRSVSLLSDTAQIKLPVSVLNKAIQLQSLLKRGDIVNIYCGYDNELLKEFSGYLRVIQNLNDGITIECEDDMFLFRKPVPNKLFKVTSVKNICEYVVQQLGLNLKLDVSFDMTYEKFTIYSATGYDVLAKIQEETKANIYISNKTLHVEPIYLQKAGEVVYDFEENIETGDLTWKSEEDRKVEVEISCTNQKGEILKVTAGVTGGERITRMVGSQFALGALKKIADEELKRFAFEGYEGKIKGWLVPYCEPTFTAYIYDDDYPERAGTYYVESVETRVSEAGGERNVTIGRKLS